MQNTVRLRNAFFGTVSFLFLFLGVISPRAQAHYLKPMAYVYAGNGVCDDCITALGSALKKVHFRVKYVHPGQLNDDFLSHAALFVVPGGDEERDVKNALLTGETDAIQRLVANGGHYLGVCLGGYLAAPLMVDTVNQAGLNLFKGSVKNHSPTQESRMEWITWQNTNRWMYFQDGPEFNLDADANAEIWARYQDGKIAAFQAPYGKGRVGLIGIHPEAPWSWIKDENIKLPDGIFHNSLDLLEEFTQKLIFSSL